MIKPTSSSQVTEREGETKRVRKKEIRKQTTDKVQSKRKKGKSSRIEKRKENSSCELNNCPNRCLKAFLEASEA